jgi:hypothetical protein
MALRLARRALAGSALIALAAVAACHRKAEPPRPAVSTTAAISQPVPASSEAPPPLTFSENSPEATVSLKLPAELGHEPELHRRLYAAEVRDLKTFAESAKAEFAEMGEAGSGALPSEKREDWSVADETSKLMSLTSLTYEFASGGAHPNVVYGAILWDKALKRPVVLPSLFKPGADVGKVQAALCDGIRTESQQRFGGARAADGSGPSCPKLDETPFELTPSTASGKAAGLTFLISPYATGAMADAPYQVTVTLPTFRDLLAPAYADEFDGEPAPPKPEPKPEPKKAEPKKAE